MIFIKKNIYEEKNKIKKKSLLFLNINKITIFKILKNYYQNINLKNILYEQKLKKKVFYSEKKFHFNNTKIIELDNEINISFYENNIDFSNYSSNIKVIALYSPIYFKPNYNISNKSNEWEDIIKVKPFIKNYHQPRNQRDDINYLRYNDLTIHEVIKKQIKLAKTHGIYGFGIYFYWNYYKILFENPLKIFLENKDINFPFFLIWRNDYFETKNYFKNSNNSEKEKINVNEVKKFTKDIKKYIIDHRYIKIKNKSVIGIYKALEIIKLKKMILKCRKEARSMGIGELFILANIKEEQIKNFKKIKLFKFFEFI